MEPDSDTPPHRSPEEETPSSPTQGHENHPQIRLACQACQRKKIKCDRNFPCGQCLRSNLQCVPSQRKPRARHIGKRAVDSELRTRITKLESLVESLSGDAGLVDSSPSDEKPPSMEDVYRMESRNMGKYMGGAFWMNLTKEVQSLREDLEEEELEDDDHMTSLLNVPNTGNHEYDLLICPPGSIYVMPGALEEPSLSVAYQLYDIYFQNVDPVMKIFHKPTLKSFLLQGTHYLGQHPDSPPNKALRAVVWHAAVTTLSEDDCFSRFGATRTELLNRYRRHADVMFAQADLINTTELITLQAFTLYNAASRCSDSSRRTWTMTALIVRIARAMCLQLENFVNSLSPFQKELRRRLWHQIRVMDVYAAVDRGSVVLITPDSWYTPIPHNVNDSEFDESSTFIPDHETGITDMTFNRMAFVACNLSMRLLSPDYTDKQETWQQRLDAALSLGKEIREKNLQYCDHTQPFHRFIYAVGNSMIASSILRAVRPIQRHLSSVPPRVDSPFVLQLAVNCIRESEGFHQDPEAQGWRWVFWVQWHGLAVTLAGLCSIRDTELANTAWSYVDRVYSRHAKWVADTTSGTLWKPIEKLYRKASAFRDGKPSPGPSNMSSPPNLKLPPGIMAPSDLQLDTLPNLQAQMLPGAMPTGGVMNGPMDIMLGDGFGDMTWMDWENLMQDISKENPEAQAPDAQPMPDLNGDWANQLRQDLM